MKLHKIFIAILLIVSTSCQRNFLDTVNPNEIGTETFWQNEADAVLALMGCYSSLQNRWVFNGETGAAGVTRLDYITDDGYVVWTWMPGGDIGMGQHNPSTWGIGDTWNALYQGIARCNLVIAKVPGIPDIEETSAKRIVAEAKVIRATLYNMLGMLFMDVPLITEPQTVETANVEKVERSVIYDFITKDLEDCVNDLPLPTEIPAAEFGRIDRGAAKAMLARIYLYNDQFAEAAIKAKEVIDLDYFVLHPEYHTLFTVANEKSKEVVFRVAFDRILDDGMAFIGYWGDGPMDYQKPLPNLAEDFYTTDGLPALESPLYNPEIPSENRDPRFSATLISNGDQWRGKTFETNDSWYFTRKYAEEDNDEDHFNSPQDFYLIRYADVLLMRAEALVRTGSYDEAEVRDLVNQVRERVNMPFVENVEGTGLSPEEMLEVIKHERRVELAFEGLRYFDLIRWNELEEKYKEYMATERQRILDLGYSDVTARAFRSIRWPIPQSERDVNKVLSQHDEW